MVENPHDCLAPLFQRLRPRALDDIVGQNHLLDPGKPLWAMTRADRLSSFILWGPPGCGKTTLAHLLSAGKSATFEPLSATTSGVSDLRRVFDDADKRFEQGKQTILFVDEIHRFNRSQQDAFLPHLERGTVVLIGATTENPSFALNGALVSRCDVFALKPLDESSLHALLTKTEEQLGYPLPLNDAGRSFLVTLADGDGRYLMRQLETVLKNPLPKGEMWTENALAGFLQKRPPLYDKNQDIHYNLISVLHKAIRGSDVQAVLYWVSRLLDGGEDRLYILRRLARCACEDIGLADPQALPQVLSAMETYRFLGSPEGDLAIAGAAVYLASAPKSNALYTAFKKSSKDAQTRGTLMPPAFALNAPTSLMKTMGYGAGYEYDHNAPHGFSGQNYFPNEMGRPVYYDPAPRGFEREIIKRLHYWDDIRQKIPKKG